MSAFKLEFTRYNLHVTSFTLQVESYKLLERRDERLVGPVVRFAGWRRPLEGRLTS